MRMTWRVEFASSRDALEATLQSFSNADFEIYQVLTEGQREGFHFTIIACRYQ